MTDESAFGAVANNTSGHFVLLPTAHSRVWAAWALAGAEVLFSAKVVCLRALPLRRKDASRIEEQRSTQALFYIHTLLALLYTYTIYNSTA